jgi:hypothetical protein
MTLRKAQALSAVAVGFTVKSGWACAVLLTTPLASPRVLDSRRVELSDPAVPESRQPYHAGFGTARDTGAELTRLVSGVKRFGGEAVAALIRGYQGEHCVQGTGVIVGSLVDPETIANDHIRIHALEGQLFRTIVSDAAARHDLPCAIWRERDLYELGARVLTRPEPKLRAAVAALGRETDGPWRAEQKAAALAAWIVLAAPGLVKRGQVL